MDAKKDNNVYTFFISGELTLENENSLKEEISGKLENDNCAKVVLDLSGMEYIDSSGIGMLVYLNKELKNSGKELALKNVSDSVMEIFKIGCFDDILKIE
ncbi:MAG: hypothetical protein A2096_06675 [Spirochaetes bacterium GWF1_41_5]|nr:MAG: hypothetical protein A2096_06675 [Spirochaetes bacterium GWF1_41_5]HBE02328.1 anti-sigma factor antagonist [Spirochaetia bacterium]